MSLNITCLNFHFKTNSTHCFALQMEMGTIWCSECQDSVQNMVFQFGNVEDENCKKMVRFVAFIAHICKQFSGKMSLGKQIGVHRGIKNLGNTCYLNSVLQCLFAASPFKQLNKRYQRSDGKLKYQRRFIGKQTQYFYDDIIEKNQQQRWNIVSAKKVRKQSQQQKLYKRDITNAQFNFYFIDFIQSMESQEHSSYCPQRILDFLGSVNKKYHFNEEQDAEQLLLMVIDLLSEGQRVSLLKDKQRYQQIQKLLGFQKLVPTQSIFGFYLLNQIQCSQCKEITQSTNLSYNIAVSLEPSEKEQYEIKHQNNKVGVEYHQQLYYPEKQGRSELLDCFFRMERLNLSKNYYSCSKCKSLVSYRRHYIISQPQVLIVSVKRFNAKLQKSKGKVTIEREIDIGSYCVSEASTKYNLFGVIVHEGSTLSSGHYICFIKIQNCWLLCSDHRVQPVDWKYVQRQQAYILLYERQPQQN